MPVSREEFRFDDEPPPDDGEIIGGVGDASKIASSEGPIMFSKGADACVCTGLGWSRCRIASNTRRLPTLNDFFLKRCGDEAPSKFGLDGSSSFSRDSLLVGWSFSSIFADMILRFSLVLGLDYTVGIHPGEVYLISPGET